LKEELKQLVQLQSVDSQLQDLRATKGDLPELVEELETRLSELEASVQTKTQKISESRALKRRTEGDLKTTEEKLKKHQNQLYDVTTNREYDAITAEIEYEKNELEEQEMKILELITFEEDTEKELVTMHQEIKEIKKELSDKRYELEQLTKRYEKKELQLQHEKEKILVRLDKKRLSSYNRIANAKHGIAVVPVTREACGGCFKTIPPQKLVEIRKMDRVIYCEVCGRILVWHDNGSPLHLR